MIKNTHLSFGFISKFLHWLMAVLLTALFVMGLYMTSLGYYDPLYQVLPWWHESLGLLTVFLLLIRFVWKTANLSPLPLKSHKKWEVFLAHWLQTFFYFLILAICISGYFISTAKGKGIEFFNLFEVGAIVEKIEEGRADMIGDAHEILSILLAILVVLHSLAAIKHHFFDKDETLKRIV